MRAVEIGEDRVVFPGAGWHAAGARARHVHCGALLRLADGTLRFLRAPANPWSCASLDAAAQLLVRFEREGTTDEDLAQRLRWELGVPGLSVPDAAVDRVDPALWDLRRAALAVVAGTVKHGPGGLDVTRASADAEALEHRYRAELEAAIGGFAAGLDREALAAATIDGRIDARRYNFLVREPVRGWRLQFARTFPILVDAAVSGRPGSVGAAVRAIVDSGAPLVDHLAQRWAVSRASLRTLIGRPVALVGAQWQLQPHTLVRILDALRPEDRPPDDPEVWQRLAAAVRTAEEIFHRPVTASPLTLGWLREAARRGFASLDEDRRGRNLPPDALPLIHGLRDAMVRHLVAEAGTRGAREAVATRAAAATIVDRQLATVLPARLAAMAKVYSDEYETRRAALEEAVRRADGRLFWPLLPREFVAADGTRRVVALATRDDLREEGALQQLCIGGGAELARMARACADGKAYLLSIREAQSGRHLSTAEIRPYRSLGAGALELRVVQHKAFENARPSAACVAALREALDWAAQLEVREHIDEGRRQAWRRRAGTPMTAINADLTVAAEALHVALGDARHAAMLTAARGTGAPIAA